MERNFLTNLCFPQSCAKPGETFALDSKIIEPKNPANKFFGHAMNDLDNLRLPIEVMILLNTAEPLETARNYLW